MSCIKCGAIKDSSLCKTMEYAGSCQLLKTKSEATESPAPLGQAELALLDTPPVQAIKDAMWFVDQILNDYDFNKRQHGLAKKCLRELHQYLDRLGV